MKKLVAIIMLLAMMVSVVGCSAPAEEAVQPEVSDDQPAVEEVPEELEKFVIGVSYQGPNNDWATNFLAHFEKEFEAHADQIEKVIYKEYGWDGEQQLADIEDLMVQGIDALVVAPHNDTGLVSIVEDVYDAGIPVICFNTAPGTDKYTALIMSDNERDGYETATWLCDRLNGEGNVIIIEGAPGSRYAEDVAAGYNRAIEEHPGVKLLGYEYAYWTAATAKQIIESYIAKGEKIDGVLCSGLTGVGVVEAFVDAGLDIPPITAGDGSTGFIRKALEVGYTDFGAIITNNFEYASGAIDLTFKVLNGEEYQKDTFVESNPAISGQELIDMYSEDMPAQYWIGGTVASEEFESYLTPAFSK